MQTTTYRAFFGSLLILLLSILLFSTRQGRYVVQAQNDSPDHVEIVGGDDVPDPNPYKWQVSIGYRNVPNENETDLGHFCGGSVIAEQWILTAAHCMEYAPGELEDPNDLRVIIDRRVRSEAGTGIEINVKNYTLHQSYRNVDGGYDIALVELIEPIPDYANYLIPLIRGDLEESLAVPDTMSIVTGWGGLKGYGANSPPPRDQTFPDVLQWVELPIVSSTVCNNALGGSIQGSMVCAGFPSGGKDACQNDSGGPLVVPDNAGGYVQLGLVSFGLGCAAPNSYGVYTRVSSYIDWIEENAKITLMDVPPTPTLTSTATFTPTATETLIPTDTATLVATVTPTIMLSPTLTATETLMPTSTATVDVTVTSTPLASTPTTPTIVPSPTLTETETLIPTGTPIATVVVTMTSIPGTPTPTVTPTPTSSSKEPQLNSEIDLTKDLIYDPADLFDITGPAPPVITTTDSVSITFGLTLMNSTPITGGSLRFELSFENKGATLHGVAIEAIIPEHSFFDPEESGLLDYTVSDEEYSRFTDIRGTEWELSDGSAACTDSHSEGNVCLFRLGTIGPDEQGIVAFAILVDEDVEPDTSIELDAVLMAANLADKTLINLSANQAIEITELPSDKPTALLDMLEPLNRYSLFLPVIQR